MAAGTRGGCRAHRRAEGPGPGRRAEALPGVPPPPGPRGVPAIGTGTGPSPLERNGTDQLCSRADSVAGSHDSPGRPHWLALSARRASRLYRPMSRST
ncbi:hypothetical protein G443_002880 [Actinoalloteichus cyanogriseus DSM 43889]|uniref:Uncharacterized protein n=1 Tax=Actinoalloteichus caeruleus DSM 43889 TaxID=1120930 RepID=A0ABT1JJC6_ACTCY|nr:hypothetical protein [Actinoalloteichus caeruleus DSM 43889]